MKKWVSMLLLIGIASVFGQAWYIENVDTTGNVGIFSSLAIDSENKPHIAYMDGDSAVLKYATWNGATWDIEIADDNSGLGGVGEFASLALSPINELPQIVYYDALNSHLKWAKLNTAGDWIVGIPDGSTTNDVGQGCDIVLGEQSGEDIAHISYYDATANYLMYARPLPTGWARDTVDSVGPLPIFGTDIRGTSITLDPNGNPHVAYYAYDSDSSTGFLKYAHLVSGNWVIDTVEKVTGRDVGLCPSIIINEEAGNVPFISYYDQTSQYFKYARWTGSTWTLDLIDNTPGVGLYGSQILGSTYASYFDASNGNLKYAYSDDYLGWHTEAVDTAGTVGMYTSIALSHKGDVNFPHISYYDQTNGNLKYATKIIKDVLPTVWWLDGYPPTFRQIHPDSAYTPKATMLNQGNTVATFNATCKIFYSGIEDYSSTKSVGPLTADEEAEVTFDNWTNLPHYEGGWYYVQIYSELADDSVLANDTLYDSLYCTIVAVKEKKPVPVSYELSVSGSSVKLALPSPVEGELYVLDVTGSRRLTLAEGKLQAGVQDFALDKSILPNGVYFVKFHSGSTNLTRKTVLVR